MFSIHPFSSDVSFVQWSLDSLVGCFYFPPRELFPFLGPLEQISFWFGLTQSGEKPARARVATAQARPDGVGEGPERVYASLGPAPPPRRP